LKRNHTPGGKTDVWDPTVEAETSAYFWKKEHVAFRPTKEAPAHGRPTCAELFAGAGGLSTGFELAGFTPVFGADIHAPSVETFRLNHPNAAAVLGDLRTLSVDVVVGLLPTRIDVLLAGVPCQGFSLNNRKRSDEDTRNFLFKELIRVAEALHPRAIVIENVSGIQSAGEGSFRTAIEQALSFDGRYNVCSARLNAADYGVPQLRERVFFVAVQAGARAFDWPEPTHGFFAGCRHLSVWDAISDLPELGPSEEAAEYTKPPLTPFQAAMRLGAATLLNHRAPRHPPETIARIARTRPGDPMYERFQQRIRLHWKRPSPTQVSGGIRPQFQFGHPNQARGLTVRERARIQSFPDVFEFRGGLVQGRVQTGNAVPPLLAKAIGSAVKQALEATRAISNQAKAGGRITSELGASQ